MSSPDRPVNDRAGAAEVLSPRLMPRRNPTSTGNWTAYPRTNWYDAGLTTHPTTSSGLCACPIARVSTWHARVPDRPDVMNRTRYARFVIVSHLLGTGRPLSVPPGRSVSLPNECEPYCWRSGAPVSPRAATVCPCLSRSIPLSFEPPREVVLGARRARTRISPLAWKYALGAVHAAEHQPPRVGAFDGGVYATVA